jgi:hypothetical protein
MVPLVLTCVMLSPSFSGSAWLGLDVLSLSPEVAGEVFPSLAISWTISAGCGRCPGEATSVMGEISNSAQMLLTLRLREHEHDHEQRQGD